MSNAAAYTHRVIVSLEFTLESKRANPDRVFSHEAAETLAKAVEADLLSNYEPVLAHIGAEPTVDAVASITRVTDDGVTDSVLSDGTYLAHEEG